MSDQKIILDNNFWKFLVSMEELKEKKEIIFMCASLSIDESTLDLYLEFLTQFNVQVVKDENYLYPLESKFQLKLEFSFSEWLALQMLIPLESAERSSFYSDQIIRNKILVAQSAYKQYAVHKNTEEKSGEVQSFENLKKKINREIVNRNVIKVHFLNSKICDFFPHRLVFLDGVLCIVGENIKDKTLLFFSLDDISDVTILSTDYEPNLSQIEVSEFIGHIRIINGKEERLVLKIYSQDEADLLPEHHFLGNPFVTSSTEGDMIWAATLEVCDDLFLWLYNMRDKVEILDPGHLRRDFAQFCELKKDNLPSKKAS